jgi:hypothetical protein
MKNIAFCLSLAAASMLCQSASLDGTWGRQTGWYCGGEVCEANDMVSGPKLRMVDAIWLRSNSSRVCGFWHSNAYKIYRGLVVGVLSGNRIRATYSQEIEHNGDFIEAKHFSQAPAIVATEFAVLDISNSQIRIHRFNSKGQPTGDRFFRRFGGKDANSYGPSTDSKWETEFLAECLAGSNQAIERTRNGVPVLPALPIKR